MSAPGCFMVPRGDRACHAATELFALRSFYRFLIAEGFCEENPANAVKLPSPNRPRVEFYSDAEADAIIAWASAESGFRWQVGRVLLLTLRYTGLRLNELVSRDSDEVDLDARRISPIGKGRRPRVAPISHVLDEVLHEYLVELRPELPASKYFFANHRGNRRLRGHYGAIRTVEEDIKIRVMLENDPLARHDPRMARPGPRKVPHQPRSIPNARGSDKKPCSTLSCRTDLLER